MKTIITLLCAMLLFSSCTKKQTQDTNTASSAATVVRSGSFVAYLHKASGTAKVTSEQGFRKLYFENFATDSGTDMRVYLSKDLTNSDYKDLGILQAISGNQVYQIDNNTDLNMYKYVLIWCNGQSTLYGSAELK